MKILHIAAQAPGRKGGGTLGILQFSYALSKIANVVDYIGPTIQEEDIENLYNERFYFDKKLTKQEKLITVMHGQFSKNYLCWKEVKQAIDFEKYNLVFLEFTKMDYVIKDLIEDGYSGKIIVRAHNVEKDFYRVSLISKPSISKVFLYLLSGKREKYMLEHADKVLTVTNQDINRFKEVYNIKATNFETCPVGIVQNKEYMPHIINKDKINCLITGSLWFGPNCDGVEWFINEVYPKVKDLVEVTVAGSRPNDKIKKLCVDNDIELVDSPESMQPYFSKCDLFVAPIFDGGGMKVKIAEAMSYGLPIVTTTHGAIGYNLENESDIYISDDPNIFAKYICTYNALSDEDKSSFSNRVYRSYIDNYSLDAIKDKCVGIIETLLNSN